MKGKRRTIKHQALFIIGLAHSGPDVGKMQLTTDVNFN